MDSNDVLQINLCYKLCVRDSLALTLNVLQFLEPSPFSHEFECHKVGLYSFYDHIATRFD